MPAVSKAQFDKMLATLRGARTGIPKAVAREFVQKTRNREALPARVEEGKKGKVGHLVNRKR